MNGKPKFGIAKRLAVSLTAALLLFVVVLGAVFSILLFRNSERTYKDNLRSVASVIGDMIASMSQDRGSFTIGEPAPGEEPPPEAGDMFRPGGEVRLPVEVLSNLISKLTNANVWLIAPNESGESYDMLFMMRNQNYIDTEYKNLNRQQQDYINALFEGSPQDSNVFGNIFSEKTISVGEPILRKDGTVMGAVIIHASYSGIFDDMKSALITMAISLVAALAAGIIMALVFSRSFSRPLVKINDTAAMISEGDYTARTDVRRNDEIGRLAETIDEMGEKLQKASEEREKLHNLRQEFVANISHELRTPVTVMRGSLEALCDGVVKDPELVDQYHSEMLKESKYMQRMVNDLLDLSRLQNPDFSMNIVDFNLFDCVSDAVRSARQMADAKGLAVNFEYDTQEYIFKGDYDRVRQMLLIVLDNAVKFTDDVSYPVTAALKGGTVRVTNTGRGITEEELPNVFERFYRSRSEDNKNGTGLGLPIARQIALRHGVGISVASVPGGETTFLFDFEGGGVA